MKAVGIDVLAVRRFFKVVFATKSANRVGDRGVVAFVVVGFMDAVFIFDVVGNNWVNFWFAIVFIGVAVEEGIFKTTHRWRWAHEVDGDTEVAVWLAHLRVGKEGFEGRIGRLAISLR